MGLQKKILLLPPELLSIFSVLQPAESNKTTNSIIVLFLPFPLSKAATSSRCCIRSALCDVSIITGSTVSRKSARKKLRSSGSSSSVVASSTNKRELLKAAARALDRICSTSASPQCTLQKWEGKLFDQQFARVVLAHRWLRRR